MKERLLFVFLILMFSSLVIRVKAQKPFCENDFKGSFSIDPLQGCVQKTVTLKNDMTNAQGVYYVYEFNKNQIEAPATKDKTSDLSYVYTKPGTYTILQSGSASGTGFVLCKDYKVRETAAPQADIVTCKSGRVRLTLVENDVLKAYDQVEINWGDGTKEYWSKGKTLFFDKTFVGAVPQILVKGQYNGGLCDADIISAKLNGVVTPPSLNGVKISTVEVGEDGKVKIVYQGMEGVNTEIFIDKGDGMFVTTGKSSSVTGAQSATFENLNPDQVYRFKLVSKDICDNLIDSDIVSSIIIKKGTLTIDEVNSITWEQRTNSGKLIQFQLLRDDVPIFTTPSEFSYLDSKVTCGVSYKYSVVAIIDNDVRSYSPSITMQPSSTSPEKIIKASVTVEGNNEISSVVELTGEGLTSTYNLVVERANSGSSDFQNISGNSNQNLTYTDVSVNTSETSYCYRFSYENACKQISPPSEAICSILLKNGVQDVSWTSESPFIGGIASYELIQTDANGQVTDEIPKQLDLSHRIDLDNQLAAAYQVKANSTDGNLVSYSNVVSLESNAIMLIPDVFTPNGDGINERFEVKSYFTTTFRMLIYSRWGEVIFQSENALDGWDGNVHGQPAPGGYYLYKIEASTSTQQQITKTGSLMLVR